jgi:PQQ-dependent catabolism-associated CXXCW motif protein
MTRRGLLGLLLAPCGAAAGEIAAPDGFRMEDYRAPTPQDVPGGRAIDTGEARILFSRPEVVWVDVLPAVRRPQGLPAGTLWRPRPHQGIPGSVWLPEVGRGALAPETEAWFRSVLMHATGGDPGRPVVFYCLADCWMSWNAAKRATGWGYGTVLWYRDGTDGWEAAGLPTEELHQAPGAP